MMANRANANWLMWTQQFSRQFQSSTMVQQCLNMAPGDTRQTTNDRPRRTGHTRPMQRASWQLQKINTRDFTSFQLLPVFVYIFISSSISISTYRYSFSSSAAITAIFTICPCSGCEAIQFTYFWSGWKPAVKRCVLKFQTKLCNRRIL